jgi:hypothetical protein
MDVRRSHADRDRYYVRDGLSRARPLWLWHATCEYKSMKQQSKKEHQTYAVPSSEDVRRPADSGGQSGDTQGLSDVAEAGSESVAELVEEGQSFEAEAISGVENAPDADVAEVHTKQVPEDDVPSEYLERD